MAADSAARCSEQVGGTGVCRELWAGLSMLALVATGCDGRSESEARADRPLEVVVPSDLATLDPRWSTRALDVKVTRLIHAGLVGLDEDSLSPIPLAASRWRFLDARRLEVELKPDLRFHSGRRLQPADVCATLRALADPELMSPHRAVVQAIGGCSPTGPRSLVVELSQPRATLLTDLEVPILRADEAGDPPRPEGTLDGLGPYRVARAASGEVLLEPASTGLMPSPHHSLVIRSVRDENARALRLLAGRADVAPNAISPALLPALEGRSGLAIRARPGANVSYLLMQNDHPPLASSATRRAIAAGIDRALIAKTLLAGKARGADWIFPGGHWAAPADLPPLRYDPARARLALSGVEPLTLLTSTDRLRVTLARAVAQMLGEVGLVVEVMPLDFGVLLARLDAGDFELAMLQMPELTEPNLLAWFFHPRGVPGEGGMGRNRARYRSPAAARWLDVGATAPDPASRAEAYAALARLMQEDMPVVPLWHEDQVAVVSERAAGFMLSAEGRWLGLARL